MNYLNYVTSHWVQIAATVTGVTTSARVLVKLLPNPKVDTYFEAVVDILKHVGLVLTPASNQVNTAPVVVVQNTGAGSNTN